MRQVLKLSLCLLLAACSRSAQQQAADTASLLDADRSLAAASMEQGSAAAFYAAMSDDALLLPSGADAVQGRERVRERLKGLGAQVLDWVPRKAEVSRGGDLGWTWGEWQLYDSAKTKHLVTQGKYLRAWKRGGDGRWRLAADIANEPPEAPAPAAPQAENPQ